MSEANSPDDLTSSESTQATRTRSLRVPASIDAKIHAALEASGLTFTQFVLLALETPSDQIRELLIERSNLTSGINGDNLQQTIKDAVEELNALRNEVRRVGININQIARQLNSTGEMSDAWNARSIHLQVRKAEAALSAVSRNVDDLDGQLYRARYAVKKTSVPRRRRPQEG